jgi:hypothetical protein
MTEKEALEHIVANADFSCEHTTSGIGACLKRGLAPDAKYWVDRCCDACIAHHALCEDAA